jgi:hypothetical protein
MDNMTKDLHATSRTGVLHHSGPDKSSTSPSTGAAHVEPLSPRPTLNSLPIELLRQILLVNLPDKIDVVFDNTRTHSWNGQSQLCWSADSALDLMMVCKLWMQVLGPIIHKRVEVVVRTPEKFVPDEQQPIAVQDRGTGMPYGRVGTIVKTGQGFVEHYVWGLMWSWDTLSRS